MKNILFIVSILLFTSSFASEKKAFEKNKTIEKTYPANSNLDLEIVNKHGDIIFETWDKDSIKIKVMVEVFSDKLEKANELINKVNIQFTTHTQFLSAITDWGKNVTGINNFMTKQTIRVDYKVMLPNGINIDIENKFGDISFEDYSGPLNASLSHGKFIANTINSGATLKINYGDLRIKNIEKATIISKFSDIRIDNAKYLNIDAKSSKLKIDKLTEASINVANSTTEIELLEDKITGNIKFGSLEIEEVSSSFRKIKLEGTNTDIDISFAPKIAFTYLVQIEKGKSFKIPIEGNRLIRKTENEEIKEYTGEFSVSTQENISADIVIRAKRSYVSFNIN